MFVISAMKRDAPHGRGLLNRLASSHVSYLFAALLFFLQQRSIAGTLRERRWQDMQKSARLLHPLHQSEHSPDVLPVKDAPVDDRPAALVIGADDLVEIAMKIVPQPAQILRSQADVIPEIVRIALYMRDGIDACGGIGHDLHDPDTSVA